MSGTSVPGTSIAAEKAAVIRFAELAEREARIGQLPPPVRVRVLEEDENEMQEEPGAGFEGTQLPESQIALSPEQSLVASPTPTSSFVGLDDIPMVDSSYIIIPPDCNGAVGPTRILQGLNNNYRIIDKATGTVITTLGTATFWAPVVAANERASLTDPKTLYDPYNNRFIAVMQTFTASAGKLLVGVSQTSDPAGAWNLYNFNTASTVDFPSVGFNKNWISISINKYNAAGSMFANGINLVVNYPSARAGVGTGTLFNLAAGTHFSSAPCVTYSATSESLYTVTHLGSAGATYAFDVITGTAAAPSYVIVAASLVRPGGGWVQPSGNILPQSAPNAGTSACAGTNCPIETQDAQVRSAPSYRGGLIYYAQTVGLPSGAMTHTGAQWTVLTTPGGAVVDGGRIDDPTATATNGGKWYAYPNIALNKNGDLMVGYSQFSSAQHPSAGYSMHLAGDGAGTMRDPVVFKAGEDYYHKTFSTATGRNRWGDFSACQVDPNDDMTLWAVQEYGKTRPGTNDGNTGANSSRWSTWWAAVAPPTVSVDAGPSQAEGNAGTSIFSFTVRLSSTYGLPITVNYHTADGSATVADDDYEAVTSSVIIPAGSLTASVPVTVNGDTGCEPNETFSLLVDAANNNLLVGAPASSGATIGNDESLTVTASAGAGGAISPNGPTALACGANQSYTITPGACFAVADVLVDGVSVGAVTSYDFTNVQAPHTIAASFTALGPFTIASSAGPGGTITVDALVSRPATAAKAARATRPTAAHDDETSVACGASQGFTITPATCNAIVDVLVDGVSVGAVTTYTFNDVQANHTISATFASTSLAAGDSHVDASCTAVADGSIDLTVTGGTPPFTFAWSNSDTTEDVDSLAVGSYSVTVTDAQGCVVERDVEIGVPQFAIEASAGPNGSIAASGTVNVDCGTDEAFTITPDVGYEIDVLLVDGVSTTPTTSYTFTNVTAAHTIAVTFKSTAVAVAEAPAALQLGRVVPNPMLNSMSIRYGLPQVAAVHVGILDLQGREIATLASGTFPSGWHSVSWNGQTSGGRARAGIYFVQFRADGRKLFQRFAYTP